LLSQLLYPRHELDYSYPASKRSKKKSLIQEGKNQATLEYDGWHLPGQEPKKSDCGLWSYMGCLNKDRHPNGEIFLKPFQKSCFRADCEKCCFKWLGRSASKATKRIELYEKQSKKTSKHIIISVPKWHWYKPKKELAKNVYNVLKKVHAVAGLVVFHPFRYNKIDQIWYYSPHFHCLGFGWIENTKELFFESGYIVKNLGKRDSVFGTIYYQLGHAGIKKHNHTLVYFGECSYSKMHVDESNEESRKCPYCKEFLTELDYVVSCELKPDPIIMNLEYLASFYQWFVKSPYQ